MGWEVGVGYGETIQTGGVSLVTKKKTAHAETSVLFFVSISIASFFE